MEEPIICYGECGICDFSCEPLEYRQKLNKMLESKIQSKITTRLEKSGWIVIKLIQTTKNGIHDIMALKKGKAIFIEVKKPGETPDDLQKYRHRKIMEAGFDSIWVDSANDERLLKYYK